MVERLRRPPGPRRYDLAAEILLVVLIVALVVLALYGRYVWGASDSKPPSPSPEPTSTTVPETTTSTVTPTTEPSDDSAAQEALAPRPPRPRASRSQARSGRPGAVSADPGQTTATRTIGSSAYCLTGTMANGSRVHAGAVASVVLPIGSRWTVTAADRASGRGLVGRTFTVEDTGGPRATFDIWVPTCGAAWSIGRPVLTIQRA